jgi:hypothetical protein
MNDMLDNPIEVGDVVLFPGGNARYGGLKMVVGIVVKMTAKRCTLLTSHIPDDGKANKTTNKTGVKVLLCNDPAVLSSSEVSALREEANV